MNHQLIRLKDLPQPRQIFIENTLMPSLISTTFMILIQMLQDKIKLLENLYTNKRFQLWLITIKILFWNTTSTRILKLWSIRKSGTNKILVNQIKILTTEFLIHGQNGCSLIQINRYQIKLLIIRIKKELLMLMQKNFNQKVKLVQQNKNINLR